jgi:hypothetical protein
MVMMMKTMSAFALCLYLLSGVSGCRSTEEPAPPVEPLPSGLLLALAVLGEDEQGNPLPQPAQTGILTRGERGWTYQTIEDPDSNVFHKAMVYAPTPGQEGILTLGGTRAILKFWRRGSSPEVLWEKDFGGKFSRMRDAEVADIYGDGSAAIAVATHDQGVVAVVRPVEAGGYEVQELDEQADTIVHEIEIGDLDADGTLEIYATPSEPNRFDGTPQPGKVVRYVPAAGEGPTVAADLGDRHAKEILADDVDGDGTDELYVSVEAVTTGQVEILRYDAGTDPASGVMIAELPDKLCRFLTAGDVDGDGRKEMVAATHKSGLWLLTPGADPKAPWTVVSIDKDSSGFEHASILADLDGDGRDELYVASDEHKEVRRYVWEGGKPVREVIYSHPADISVFTWNIMPVPVAVIPES